MASYMRWAGRAVMGGAFVAGGFLLGGPLGAAAGAGFAAKSMAELRKEDNRDRGAEENQAGVKRTRKSFSDALADAAHDAKNLGNLVNDVISSMVKAMGKGLQVVLHGAALVPAFLAFGATKIVDGLAGCFNGMPKCIQNFVGGAADVLKGAINFWIRDVFGGGLKTLGCLLNKLFDGLGTVLGELFGGAADMVGMLFFGAAHVMVCASNKLIDIGDDILKKISNIGHPIASEVFKLSDAGVKETKARVERTRKSFSDALANAARDAKNLGNLVNDVTSSISKVMGKGLQVVLHGAAFCSEKLAGAATAIVDDLAGCFKGSPDWIQDFIGQKADNLKKALNYWMVDVFGGGLRTLGDFLNYLFDGLGTVLGELFGGAADMVGMLFFGVAHVMVCASNKLIDIGDEFLKKIHNIGHSIAPELFKLSSICSICGVFHG